MRPTNDSRQALGWAFAFFLVALAANAYRLGWWMPLPDETGYADTATAWLSGGQGQQQGAYASAPMLVAIASMLQRFGVTPIVSVRLVAAVFGAGIIAVTYLLLRRSTGEWTARGVALSMLAFNGLRMYSRVGQRETLHILFGLMAWSLVVGLPESGRARMTPGRMIATGLILGIGLWAKQIAFLYVFAVVYFVIASDWNVSSAARKLAWLFAGFAGPAVAIAARTMSAAKVAVSADMNMPSAGVVAGAKFAGASVIAMLGIPVHAYKLLGIVVLIVSAGFVVRGCLSRRPLATLAAVHFTAALLFFSLFERKQDYYLLPSAMVLVFALIETVAAPIRSSRTARVAAGGILVVLALFNVSALPAFYVTRGPDENFLRAMQTFGPRSTISSSHAELVDYINREEHLGLTVLPLFDDSTDQILSYGLNAATLADPRLDGIVLKDYYYDRLRAEAPGEWDAIARALPSMSRGDGLVVFRRSAAAR